MYQGLAQTVVFEIRCQSSRFKNACDRTVLGIQINQDDCVCSGGGNWAHPAAAPDQTKVEGPGGSEEVLEKDSDQRYTVHSDVLIVSHAQCQAAS